MHNKLCKINTYLKDVATFAVCTNPSNVSLIFKINELRLMKKNCTKKKIAKQGS